MSESELVAVSDFLSEISGFDWFMATRFFPFPSGWPSFLSPQEWNRRDQFSALLCCLLLRSVGQPLTHPRTESGYESFEYVAMTPESELVAVSDFLSDVEEGRP